MDQEFIDLLGAEQLTTLEPEPLGRMGDLLSESEDESPSLARVEVLIPASSELELIPGQLDDEYRLPEVSPADADALATLGTEAIACYVSFHFRRRRWGIYLSRRRLEAFAASAFSSVPGLTDAERVTAAFTFVLDHERFHYWTDIAATQMELAAKQPVYVPYMFRNPGGSALAQTEEALANGRARARLPSKELRRAAEGYMKRQPAGYRDWPKYAGPRKTSMGKRSLGAGIQGSALPAWRGALPFEWFFDEHRSGASGARIPLHLVDDPSGGWSFLGYYSRPVEVTEDPRFVAALRRLPPEVQSAWQQKTKPKLETGEWGGTDFKKFAGKKDVYRCRVGRNHRVHFLRTKPNTYQAVEIGPRQGM